MKLEKMKTEKTKAICSTSLLHNTVKSLAHNIITKFSSTYQIISP